MNNYRIFISHSWTYDNHYSGLINLLNQRSYFSFTDYSVPKSDPIHSIGHDFQLYAAIRNQIQPCNVVIIMAGVYSSYSKWIDKEIQIAQTEFSKPKPIIAVRPWAQTNISTKVQNAANEIVGWNTDSIVNAVRRYAI